MLAADGTARKSSTVRTLRVRGAEKPRVAPPTPARSKVEGFKSQAKEIGYDLFPWQITAARYITALARGERWLYPEIALIVARQNGKTTELVPLIVERLRAGRRIMHTAQNRELPREVFGAVADAVVAHYALELKSKPRFANGQEEIRTTNGGIYRIVAPTRGGARGPSNDDVIVDELREMDDFDFIAAAKPTLTASPNPQMIYLSNAGTESSAVLNALRKRAEADPQLAYLEWSAAPERQSGDVAGWLEANPSVGHIPTMLDYLEKEYRTATLEDTLAIFETEHLCRWVTTTLPPLVEASTWAEGRAELPAPVRPVLGLGMDHDGTRASAAIAWPLDGDRIAVQVIADVTGDPIDLERFGPELRALARTLRVMRTVHDPYSDPLASYLRRPDLEREGKRDPRVVRVSGEDFTNACGEFVRLVEGRKLVWADSDAITTDLPWLTRRKVSAGVWQAALVKPDRPATAALAAIRAVGAANGPRPAPPRIY